MAEKQRECPDLIQDSQSECSNLIQDSQSECPDLISDSSDSEHEFSAVVEENFNEENFNKDDSNVNEVSENKESQIENGIEKGNIESDASSDEDGDNDVYEHADDHEDEDDEDEPVRDEPVKDESHPLEKASNFVVKGVNNKASLVAFEDKLQTCLEQATAAYVSKNYQSSAAEYKIALMLLSGNKRKSDHDDVWRIKYFLGLSLIHLTLLKDIHESEKVFQSLIDEYEADISILGYLGLAKVYLRQNRFHDAASPLQTGLQLINDGVLPPLMNCLSPSASAVDVAADDSSSAIKHTFERLLSECLCPPPPLAICRYPNCSDPIKPQIYQSDPEFKGYTQVACLEKCLMEYHRDCWRTLKARQLDKQTDKDLLGGMCMTPDCQSIICRISVFDSDGNILKVLSLEENSRTKKPGHKYKNVSVQPAKVTTQKRGKKTKGGAALEEKVKVDDCATHADGKARAGDQGRGREETKAAPVMMAEGGRTMRTTHRRRSADSTENGGSPEAIQSSVPDAAKAAKVDPLISVKRTDFVPLQKKKNEELAPENLSKKANKKKREKERQKKLVHINEFVEKIENDDGNNCDEPLYWETGSNGGAQYFEIPPPGHISYRQSDSWLPVRTAGSLEAFGYPTIAGHSQELLYLPYDLTARESTAFSTGASRSGSSTPASVPNELTSKTSGLSEASCETEDLKGNIMSQFESFLEKVGPCLPDDERVQTELSGFSTALQVMIASVGGISKLLLQSLKFTVVDGYICLLKDAPKARQMARQRRMELLSGKNFLKKLGGAQSAVKTASSNPCVVPSSNIGNASALSSAASAVSTSTSTAVSVSKVKTASAETLSNPSSVTNMKYLSDVGLSDLNAYKEFLQNKGSSNRAVVKKDPTTMVVATTSTSTTSAIKTTADDDSNLSVIEKFKKQVHKAASKEKTRVQADDVNLLLREVKTLIDSSSTSLFNTGVHNENRNGLGDTSYLRKTKGRQGTSTFSDLSDIEAETPKITDDDGIGFSEEARRLSAEGCGDMLKNSLGLKSTLNATAAEFHFPASETRLTQAGAGVAQNRGNRRRPEFDSICATASDDFIGIRKPTLSGVSLVASTSSNYSADSGYFCSSVDKACNTDESMSRSDDYEQMKRERDDLVKNCSLLVQINKKQTEDQRALREKLELAEMKSQVLEKEANMLRSEKNKYEEDIEKLRSDLSLTKTSLQSANHLVSVTDRLLEETRNALKSEEKERNTLHDKYESLLSKVERNMRTDDFDKPEPLAKNVSNAADLIARKKSKRSFDKIINMLSAIFPNLSRMDLSRCVQEVRVSRNNTLSGLTVQEIVAHVREFIMKEQAVRQIKKDALDLPYNIPNTTKYISNSNTNGGQYCEEIFQEEADPCIICHEELIKESTSMLDCGHSFHTECVRKWFREQSTCPTCRNHALLPDEFPALGRTRYQ